MKDPYSGDFSVKKRVTQFLSITVAAFRFAKDGGAWRRGAHNGEARGGSTRVTRAPKAPGRRDDVEGRRGPRGMAGETVRRFPSRSHACRVLSRGALFE